jgi:hypothetical protein
MLFHHLPQILPYLRVLEAISVAAKRSCASLILAQRLFDRTAVGAMFAYTLDEGNVSKYVTWTRST